MLRQFRGLARATLAAGAWLAFTASAPHTARADELPDPRPGRAADTETVSVLQGARDGQLNVSVRGQGQDQVRFTIKNTVDHRLNVVFPAGLVASAATGQGGFQSMGLGTPTRNPGAFGAFAGTSRAGFQAIPANPTGREAGVAVPAGETIELSVPSVCLNYGVRTPNARDLFRLVDVDEYTPDPRARKALRSLALLGTSQSVAQAVAWNVFNNMSFGQMAAQTTKVFNAHELALAARFIDALDSSSASNLVEADYFRNSRVFVRVTGPEKDTAKLARELEEQTLLGLPIRVVDALPGNEVGPSALFVEVVLVPSGNGQVRGRLQVRGHSNQPGWFPVGQASLGDELTIADLDGPALASAIDRSLASTFVTVRAVRRAPGTTTFRLENRLPMTVAAATLRTGRNADGGLVQVDALGLGPARATITAVPAANVTVERVELNGL